LTFTELKRIEAEFWDTFQKEQVAEISLMQKLEEYSSVMDSQYRQIRPLFDSLDEKITTSEFYDIIE
jgi:hypothetical protein